MCLYMHLVLKLVRVSSVESHVWLAILIKVFIFSLDFSRYILMSYRNKNDEYLLS